ncbi:MAG: hypothetical protein WCI55_12220 [Armatimonadota bacterium]
MRSLYLSDTRLGKYLNLPDNIANQTSHLFLFNYLCAYLALTERHKGGHVLIDDELSSCFVLTKGAVKIRTETLSILLGTVLKRLKQVGKKVGSLEVEKLCSQVFEKKTNWGSAILRDEWTSLGLKPLPIPWGRMTSKNLWQFPAEVRKNVVTFLMIWKRFGGHHDLKMLIASYVATK